MKIALWSITKVKPYGRNPRVITDEAVAKTAASIKEFGWRQPIVVDAGGVVIAGHTRLLAAQSLGLAKGARARRGWPLSGPDKGVQASRQPDQPGGGLES